MSYINVTNIQLKNNPSPFGEPLTFQITFECLKDLPEEIEWKLVYIGSSKDVKYDQVLDSFSMGPLEYGVMQFDLESSPPDSSKIPQSEILGVTAIILSVSYNSQEFFRVGYYVYNFYEDPEMQESPPEQVQIDKITRNILADKPRITRFDIKWGDEKDEENPENTENSVLDASKVQENEQSFMEKMHLFMGEGDMSQSIEVQNHHSQNPFLTAAHDESNHYSGSFAPDNSGYAVFGAANTSIVEENQNNPFA